MRKSQRRLTGEAYREEGGLAVLKDPELYQLLALVDALRDRGARERLRSGVLLSLAYEFSAGFICRFSSPPQARLSTR
jgi:hypothetical protein